MRWTHSQLTRHSPAGAEKVGTFRGRGRRLEVVQDALAEALTVSEVAAALGVHPSTVYGLCDRRELVHFRVANAIRVRPEDLAAFVDERRRDA